MTEHSCLSKWAGKFGTPDFVHFWIWVSSTIPVHYSSKFCLFRYKGTGTEGCIRLKYPNFTEHSCLSKWAGQFGTPDSVHFWIWVSSTIPVHYSSKFCLFRYIGTGTLGLIRLKYQKFTEQSFLSNWAGLFGTPDFVNFLIWITPSIAVHYSSKFCLFRYIGTATLGLIRLKYPKIDRRKLLSKWAGQFGTPDFVHFWIWVSSTIPVHYSSKFCLFRYIGTATLGLIRLKYPNLKEHYNFNQWAG